MAASRIGIAAITGAAQGIGKGIALRLARDGFDVALNDLPRELPRLQAVQKMIEDTGRRVVVETGDVTQEDNVKRFVDKCVSDLGGLDVMVANAGACPAGAFLDGAFPSLTFVICLLHSPTSFPRECLSTRRSIVCQRPRHLSLFPSFRQTYDAAGSWW